MNMFQVTELLVKHGATVNVSDLWKFTPLHEAAAKVWTDFIFTKIHMYLQGKYEIVKLLLKHGADATKKNRDGHTPLDLVKVTFLRKASLERLSFIHSIPSTKVQNILLPGIDRFLRIQPSKTRMFLKPKIPLFLDLVKVQIYR